MSTETGLAALARRFPGWQCWRGMSGLYYARRREDSPVTEPVSGEDPTDLADQIGRAERLAEGGKP